MKLTAFAALAPLVLLTSLSGVAQQVQGSFQSRDQTQSPPDNQSEEQIDAVPHSPCAVALKKIEASFNHAFEGYHASILIHHSGEVVYQKSYGQSNGAEISNHTRFLLGSDNKALDAVIALRLKERGQLDLTRHIRSDLPTGFQSAIASAGLTSEWNKITLRNLLNHTSGIKDYLNLDTEAEQEHADQVLATPRSYEELLDLAGKKLWFTPLSKLEYSNTNYMILTKILESVTQTSYPALLRTEVVSTLGLTETGVADGSQKGIEGGTNIALSNLTGVGSAYSSAADLMHFLEALDTKQLVNASSLDLMFNPDLSCGPDPTCLRYGMGFSVRKEPGTPLAHWVTHQGHLHTVSNAIAKVPDSELNMSLVSDRGDYELEDLVRATLLTLLNSSCVSDSVYGN